MNTLTLLCGIPSSGKSSWVKIQEEKGVKVHSSDNLRKELYGDEGQQGDNQELFLLLHKRIREDLINGLDVSFDATNISYKKRMEFLKGIKKIDCIKNCLFFATPFEDCVEANKKRDRVVDKSVIERMYKNIFIPQLYEGFDNVEILWNFDKTKFSLDELFNGKNGLNDIEQENPNHTLTIGKHCLKTHFEIEKLDENISFELSQASLLHDIGKRFCKSFNEEKGFYTYYQHNLVSAYDALFYLKAQGIDDNRILKIVNYIQWHMYLFFIKEDKTREKFIKLVGIDFYTELQILHIADILSR